VYVVNDKNLVEQRPVTLGEWYGEGWIIEKGLQPGERVVTDRLMQVRPGTAVAATVRAEVQQASATIPAGTTTTRPAATNVSALK
jgi:membrane fusion protein (multidrug efflux system)